jgi:peptide/nickel transport system permease protein
MIASGAKYLISNQWWPAIFPGIALGVVVFSFGVFGEVLTKIMEPRAVVTATWRSRKAFDSEDAQPVTFNVEPPKAPQDEPILTVDDLSVAPSATATKRLLDGVTFSLAAGERLAIVGESGCGKSILVKAVLGLLPPQLMLTSGMVRYDDIDLLTLDKSALRSLRSKHIAATLTNAKSQL